MELFGDCIYQTFVIDVLIWLWQRKEMLFALPINAVL